MRVLVVEDDHAIAQAIKQGLEQESFAVDIVHDGEDGYNTARNEEYDLIVLDVLLPGMLGFEITEKLRQAENHTPILILSAKDQVQDKIRGLNAGVDDYMVKPFSFEELLARVKALLRRPHEQQPDILQADNLTFNTITKEVYRAGVLIHLSIKEYALLEYLLRNKGKVLSKNNIMTHVWDFDADILPNTVEVFITFLRAKIDKPFKRPPLIQTIRGFGYKINPSE